MTATWSQTSPTTPRSWVIMIMAVENSSLRLRISSSTWAWMVTSRAVVGSSAMMSPGLQASAMAMTTRWRMPPLNSWGYSLYRWPGICTFSSISMAFFSASASERFWWATRASEIWTPTVTTGFRDVIGS